MITHKTILKELRRGVESKENDWTHGLGEKG